MTPGTGRSPRPGAVRVSSRAAARTRDSRPGPAVHRTSVSSPLRNRGSQDSPLLEQIEPLDIDLPVHQGSTVTFHYAHGSTASALDYAAVDADLSAGKNVAIAHYIMENGVQKDSYLPFFNLQWPDGGLLGAIGWTGQWMVSAGRSSARSGSSTNRGYEFSAP